MYYFYLQHPPPCKHFDPWDVEYLLPLLENWAPASSLTTFNLAQKTATLLALVTVKCCSDLTLLCIDNQHPFSSASCCYFHSNVWWQDRLTESSSSSDLYWVSFLC